MNKRILILNNECEDCIHKPDIERYGCSKFDGDDGVCHNFIKKEKKE